MADWKKRVSELVGLDGLSAVTAEPKADLYYGGGRSSVANFLLSSASLPVLVHLRESVPKDGRQWIEVADRGASTVAVLVRGPDGIDFERTLEWDPANPEVITKFADQIGTLAAQVEMSRLNALAKPDAESEEASESEPSVLRRVADLIRIARLLLERSRPLSISGSAERSQFQRDAGMIRAEVVALLSLLQRVEVDARHRRK